MSTISISPSSTARYTGLAYLGLAIFGMLGFLVVRNQLFVAGDGSATLSNIVTSEGLARLGVALELAIVLSQAAAALLFYKLFRGVSAFAAGTLTVFGMMNAVAILGSAAMLGSALAVASNPSLNAVAASNVQLLYLASDNFWAAGNLFFGLWLLPMGWLALKSSYMPKALGWLLMVGGVGYVASGFVAYLLPGADLFVDLLTYPATAAEFWMIVQLFVVSAARPPALTAAFR